MLKVSLLFNKLGFLQVGDIIWAKRYKNEEERESIKAGHRESPYVIIKKTLTKIYALQCTSNPHIKNKRFYYPLEKYSYKLNKTSYINLTTCDILTNKQYIKTVSKIKDDDLIKLKKLIVGLLNDKKEISNLNYKDLKYTIDVGDIVLYSNNKYYVYDIENNYLHLYNVSIKNALIGSYKINYDHRLKLARNKKVSLLDSLNSGEIKLINEMINRRYTTENFKKKYLKLIQPMMIFNNVKNNNNYLVISKKSNLIEIVNISNIKDYHYILLEKNNFDYQFFRVINEEEYKLFLKALNSSKNFSL